MPVNSAHHLLNNPELTENTIQALNNLRNPEMFKWHSIPIFLIVLYIYINEWSKNNKSVVIAGLAFWTMDLFNEIWNSIALHFTKTAPVWGTPGNDSAFILLPGLNIEISLMFAVFGICAVKLLPKDKKKKILGINNRIFMAFFGSASAVIIEILLNLSGALTWELKYWNIKFPYLIFLAGYLPFFLVAYFVYDMDNIKKQILTLGVLLGFDCILIFIFGFILKWL